MATWFYVENDTRIGPVSHDEVQRLIGAGQIRPDTLVWQDGMADWVAANSQFEFTNTPPGVPPAAPGGAQTGADGLYVGAPARGFGEAISVCFSKYVGFSGRASRSEFWFWALFTLIAGFITGLLDGLFFGGMGEISPLNSLFSLATFLPGLAVGFRRLHDTGRSGWWIGGFVIAMIAGGGVIGGWMAADPWSSAPSTLLVIFGIAVLIYSIVLIVFYCQKGDPGPNQYG